jgi:hypothetical protein
MFGPSAIRLLALLFTISLSRSHTQAVYIWMVSRGKIDPHAPIGNRNKRNMHVSSGIAASIAFPKAIGSMATIPDPEVVVLDDEDDEDSDDEIDPPPLASTMNTESELIVRDDEDEDDQDSDPADNEVDPPPPPASTTNNAMHVTETTGTAAGTGTATATSSVARGPNPDVLEAILALSRASEIYEI